MKKSSKRIILGSGSPRRRELLAGLDVDFTVDTGNTFEESVPEDADPAQVPLLMALGKSHGFHRPLEDDELLITADTVVIVDGAVLGKPHSREEAARMLRLLSGREHAVLTGVSIFDTESGEEISFAEETAVRFRALSDAEIARYVESGDPLDKAGSYGYQSGACIFVEGIRGDYFNVVGLPVCRVAVELRKFGVVPR